MYSNQDLIELVDILRAEDTETEWLEFKSNYLSNQDIGEYISALSNGAALRGRPFGYLIFGVDDTTHEVIGTVFDYRKQKQGNEGLENWLNRLTEPKIGLAIYNVQYAAGKRLVMFEIPAAFNQLTAFAGKESVRIGSYRQDLRRYPETEKQLWYALNRVSYEQTTSSEQNLHFKEMTLIARSRGLDFSEEKFARLRMLDGNGKFNNLALLLSDENPHIVKFAVYKNKGMDFAVKKEFSGSWIAMLDQVLEYVNLYNDTSARVIGSSATRTEVQSYPDPSLREIVVNAFAHFDAGFPSDVKIEFYPDRVEIASPGALYRTTMKEVLSGRQSFRNPNLVYVLNKFNYIENYATGLKKTLTAYAPYAVSPKYESTEHFFVVTLPNVKWTGETADAAASEMSDKHDGVNVGENDGVKLSPTQKKVLEHLRKNGALSAAELANAIGKTQRTVERALAELKVKGFLARVGSDKTGYWNVLK